MNVAPDDPDDVLADAAAVRRTVMWLSRRLRVERSHAAVSNGKLSLLGHLRREGPLGPAALAALEHTTPSGLTRNLAELELEGLVARSADPGDGRRVVLELTGAGLALLADDVRQRDAWLARAMAESLSPAERKLVRLAAEVLDTIVADETARVLRSVS